MIQDIVTVDWSKVRWKRAGGAFLVLFAALAFLGAASDVTMTVVLATLFVTAVGGGGSLSERLPPMIAFAAIGAVIGALAFWSFESVVGIAVVLGVATYLGTLAAAAGPDAARGGLFLTLWAVFAILFGSTGTPAWEISLAFLIGSAIGIAIVALRLRLGLADEPGSSEGGHADAGSSASVSERLDLVRSAVPGPIGQFALLRAVAIAVGVLLGNWWFPDYPLWVAITVLVSLQPSAGKSVSVAIERTLGTGLGVLLAVGIAQLLPQSEVGVVIAFAISGFLMVAFQGANYTLFAMFLTAMLIFGQRLAQADAFEAGWQRLLATIVGGVIALAVAAFVEWLASRERDQQAT